jgi:DNA-binding LytR/AlgR family response regulator
VRALIVDDEPLARSRLGRMLEAIDGVVVVAEAGDGHEALERIASDQPDVVFLDIRMPGLDGLSVASSSDSLPPIVFTTAYDEHAVDAFDAAAVDYLLKPIQRARLHRAVERVRQHLRAAAPATGAVVADVLRRVLDEGDQRGVGTCRVQAVDGQDVHLFDARELTRFFASDKYVVFRHAEREHLVEESLSELQTRLGPHGFFRTHRSELVNLRAVKTLTHDDHGTTVVLNDGQRARVSRRLVAELKRALGLR